MTTVDNSAATNAAIMAQATKNTQDGMIVQSHMAEQTMQSTAYQTAIQNKVETFKAGCKASTMGPDEVEKITNKMAQ